MTKKTMDLHARVTPEVRDHLKQQAEAVGKSMSEHLRDLILTQDVRTNPFVRKELAALRHEINKIGVNVNQIVKNNNSGLYREADKKRLEENMEAILERLESFQEELGSQEAKRWGR